MNNFQIQFYENWNVKLRNIEGDDLMSVFDRFYTAFVIYNFLYNQVPKYQIRNGRAVPRGLSDKKLATNYIAQTFGCTQIENNLEQDCSNEIEVIKDLILQEHFYINLNYSERQRNEDLTLLSELNSRSANTRVIALLKIIYYVRCNTFHGHKDFEQRQSNLLMPLTKILVHMNRFVYNQLITP